MGDLEIAEDCDFLDECIIFGFQFNLECNFMEVLQIRQIIPPRWREVIYDVTKCFIDTNVIYCNNGKIECISKTTCKDVYWNFVTNRKRYQDVVKNGLKTIQI